jgi:competence protein ComGC
VTSGPPAAWYADPGGSGGLRYWDGTRWTEHVTPPPGQAGGYGSILPQATSAAQPASGRRLWPLFAVIGVLFLVAVIAGLALAVPKVVKAGGRVTDEAAQSTARVAVDAGAQVYALEGSYVGATPARLEDLESGLSFTNGPSTDFTTVSVLAGEERFVVAVASLSGRCYVAIIGDEIGGPRTTGRLGEGVPCWATFAADQTLIPVDDF